MLLSQFKCETAYNSEISLLSQQKNQSVNEVSSTNPNAAPLPINITYGYSRDHRPDLKQFIIDLICSGDGDVRLFVIAQLGAKREPSIERAC